MKFKWILISLFFIFTLISNTYVSCASVYYKGAVIFPKLSVVGKDDAFILAAVYKLSLPPNISSSAIDLSIENIPDYEYLFYINSSGAYLVYKAMLPYNSPPAQVFPIVGYYNNSWYLLLDHSAVTFNVSPRRAIGIYKFNKSCLSSSHLLPYNVSLMTDTIGFTYDDGNYIEARADIKASRGFYFKIPKPVLDKYFGPNTTAGNVLVYSFPGRETAVILPIEGALMKNSENPSYIFIKHIACGLKCNYSVVANFTSESDFPYYGVLFYSKNGSIRFVPLIQYDLNSSRGQAFPYSMSS